jgi:LuxR family transcriptional regulator, quorum-sensing system regulator CciR
VRSFPDYEVIDRLNVRSAVDIRAAAETLNSAVMSLAGMRTAPCADIASKRPMVDGDGEVLASTVFGWNGSGQRWWEVPQLALYSPLTTVCRYESQPFWCNKLGIHSRHPNPHIAELDLGTFIKYVMTGAAIVVPIHLPFAQIAAVSFRPLDEATLDLTQQFADHAEVLDIYSRAFVCSYVKVMSRQHTVQPEVRLSKREVECLRWAALGKTDDEIAVIIQRSCPTIRFHIHNAAVKLDAVTRSQAVFKATQLGYFGPVT